MADDKRQAILDAAIFTFARKGFHATRISDVAERAGIGKGTVYLYFESKEDLLISIFQSYVEEAMALVEGLVDDHVDPRRGIEVFFERGLSRFVENPDLLAVLQQRLFLTDPELQKRGEAFFRTIVERIVAKIEMATESGMIRRYDPPIIACAILGALSTFKLYQTMYPEQQPKETMSRVAQELPRFFAAALVPDPDPPTTE